MRAGRLILHVLGDRSPLAGATLSFAGACATTDATGRVEMSGLSAGMHVGWLAAPGYVAELITVAPSTDPHEVIEETFRLRRGVTVRGRVIVLVGAAPADAVVHVRGHRGTPVAASGVAPDGRWSAVVPEGTYRVVATSDTWGVTRARTITVGRQPIDLDLRFGIPSALRRTAHRLRMRARPTTLAGTVVDASGRPVAGADVRVLGARFVHADTRGRFEVNDLRPGEYDVAAGPAGPWSFGRTISARTRARTGQRDLRLVLPAGAVLCARVSLDGVPVPYVGVRLIEPHVMLQGGGGAGIATEGGRLRIEHVAPGTWRLAVVAPGTHILATRDFTVSAGETLDLGDLALERGHRLTGRVTDASGRPIAGARILVGVMWQHPRMRSKIDHLFHGQHDAYTDEQGAYAVDWGDVMSPHQRELAWATHPAHGVSLIRAVTADDTTVDFVLLGAGDLQGRVTNMRGGRPFLEVMRDDEPAHARHAQTDDTGAFTLTDVPPGEYELRFDIASLGPAVRVTVADRETAHATLEMTTTTVELSFRLPPGAAKTLKVEPVSPEAMVEGKIASSVSGVSGGEDRYYLRFVRPGQYRVSLDGESWKTISVSRTPAEQTFDLR